jgi:hypothetical protein
VKNNYGEWGKKDKSEDRKINQEAATATQGRNNESQK